MPKATAVMAMLARYVTSAGPDGDAPGVAPVSLGPIPELAGQSPPSRVQTALKQYLQQHRQLGLATAEDVLQTLLQLTPDAMSGTAEAGKTAISGWQAPGSPMLAISHTPQVRS